MPEKVAKTFRLIAEGDAEASFVCKRGDEQVAYLRDHAWFGHHSDTSRTYVLEGPPEGPALLGFYAICMGRVTSTDLPENKGKKTQMATPAALLAQLATDDRATRGLGVDLVFDALERIMKLADQIGCRGTVLHAQTPALVKYYEGIGFKRIGSSTAERPQMWLSVADFRATVEAVGSEEQPGSSLPAFES